jgi:hypothetical protein
MRQVIFETDRLKFEKFKQEREKAGMTAEAALIKTLQTYTEFANEPRPPKLRAVRPESPGQPAKPQKARTTNVTGMGLPERPTETIKIKLNINEDLYSGLAQESAKTGTTVQDLISELATDRIRIANPEMSETARDMLAYIGIPLIEAVK